MIYPPVKALVENDASHLALNERVKRKQRAPAALLAAYLLIAFLFGGAGSEYPLLALAIEVAAVPVLFCFIAGFTEVSSNLWTRSAIILAAAILLLPLAQLSPFPPALLHHMPGRAEYDSVLVLINSVGPRSISLDPDATWRALLELLVGSAAFVGVLSLNTRQRSALAVLILGFALVSVVVGAFQAAGAGGLMFYDSAHNGLPIGLFTNRNHQAALLNVAIVFAATLPGIFSERALARAAVLPVIILFVAGVIGTGSRAGIALLCLSLPAAITLMSTGRSRWRVFGGVAVALVIGVAALWFTSAGQTALQRFGALDDPRFSYWADTRLAVSQFWPVGSGFGTFPEIFETFESLASVGPPTVNHAHNDYLELALEGGAASVLLLVIGTAFLAAAGIQRVRTATRPPDKVLAQAALVAIVLLMLHSTVDYPLRRLSLMALFGCLAGLLFNGAPTIKTARWRRRSGSLGPALPVVVGVIAIATAYEAARVHLAEYAILSRSATLARSLAPSSADASTWIAQKDLAEGNLLGAVHAASRALRLSPTHTRAISVIAVAESAAGNRILAAKLMSLAGQFGWRDPITQAWLLDAALRVGMVDVAAQRADALLRQGLLQQPASNSLRRLLASSDGRRAVIIRLADHPQWRKQFLTKVSNLSDQELSRQAELLMQMRQSRVPLGEDEWVPLVNQLVTRRRIIDAHSLWAQMRGGTAATAKIFDGGFDSLATHWPGGPVPFEWRPASSPETKLEITNESNGNPALHISMQSGAAGVTLEQLLVLRPGQHSLSVQMRGANTRAARIDVDCATASRPNLEVRNNGQVSGVRNYSFVVPAGCEGEWLRVLLTGDASEGDLWLDSFKVQ